MKKEKEKQLYEGVAEWLASHLQARNPRARVSAHDTHSIELSDFLRRERLHHYFENSEANEIQVDVTGIVQQRDLVRLAFVECKAGPITLRDVGQLLGYSLVARPEWSFLLSPEGLSDHLSNLLLAFGRQDILTYGKNKHIRIATWNRNRREMDASSLVPKGSHI